MDPTSQPDPARSQARAADSLASAPGWPSRTFLSSSGALRRHWRITLPVAVALELLVLLPFALIDPTAYFGMPGALATAISIGTAVALGPWAGLLVAGAGGIFFLTEVADAAHPFKLVATLLTIVVWLVVALLAGLVAERLRQRLVLAFAEIEARGEQQRLTLEAADAAVGLFTGSRLVCREANRRLRGLFSREDWQGAPLDELLTELDPDVRQGLQACAIGRQSRLRYDEVRLKRRDGVERSYSFSVRCAYDKGEPTVFLTLTDVTAVADMRRSLEQLLDLSQELSTGTTPLAVATSVCRTATSLFDCQVSSYWAVGVDRLDLVARAPRPATRDSWDLTVFPELTDVIRTRLPQFIADAHEHYRLDTPASEESELQEYIRREAFGSMMWLPVPYGGRIGAVLFLGWDERIERPGEETLALATRFADEAAIAVERTERLGAQREVEALLRALEARLLPRFSVTDASLAVAFRYRAGERRMSIGGDFLGAIEQSDGQLALLIGDVSGHGPEAAALGATLRASWRALALAGTPPLSTEHELDELVRRDRGGPEEFATVCLGWLSPDRRKLRMLLAGHHRPLLIAPAGGGEDEGQSNGGAPSLAVGEAAIPYGMPLGIAEPGDIDWEVSEIDLPPHWSLLLYTDGLVEGLSVSTSRERFGLRRLLPIVARELNGDPGAALDRVLAEVQAANGRPLPDDVALLLVQTRDQGARGAVES
jgi:PAS domain S-box-containing protein